MGFFSYVKTLPLPQYTHHTHTHPFQLPVLSDLPNRLVNILTQDSMKSLS